MIVRTLIFTVISVTSFAAAARSWDCGWRGCVHFLDQEFEPIVFTLDKDGLRSYAIATFHATISRARLPRSITKAIDAAPTFINEISPAETFPVDLLNDPAERRLHRLISPAAWDKLARSFPMFRRVPPTIRPFVPYRMYTEMILAGSFGTPAPRQLLDVQLLAHARARGRELRSLETVREVVAALVGHVTPELLEWTLTSLEPHEIVRAFDEQRTAFRRGDLDQFTEAQARAQRTQRTESFFARMVTDRNRAWVPRLLELHESGPFALAIGARHLGGPGGLLVLLARAGFRVRPLR